ncbi:type II secretion system F family protein [Lysinibacillus sp. BW-2-10]|uniref:type II secretion system F family protein n=1 Tax=Lysinibacillus sp. BW-2-10 TaxID=2590030 RepID=UPI0011809976|nr:type II secretion system F family protein [Lysinibacillus sp. BW-2-10]TSI02279.1 type II secretion system F family protein [Lysinibacillus sp. BW-2-10]
MEKFTILFSIFLVFTFIFALVGLFMLNQKRLNLIALRLNTFIPDSINESSSKEDRLKKFRTPSIITLIGENFKNLPINKKLKKQIQEAGLLLKPEDFYVVRIATSLCPFLITLLLGYHFIISIMAILIGFWIPVIYLNYRRKKRLIRCVNQLAEALGIMANSLRAGFSFMQAMQLIGKEMPDPLGPEFERTVQDVSYGVPLEKAFENLVDRLPDKTLEMVLSALLIQRKSGGNLAELLETMQETVQGRVRIKEEIKTLTAEGRISGVIITLLPIALGFYFYLVNPDYFTILLEEPLGWLLLGFGSFFLLVGWLVIRMIIRIEV